MAAHRLVIRGTDNKGEGCITFLFGSAVTALPWLKVHEYSFFIYMQKYSDLAAAREGISWPSDNLILLVNRIRNMASLTFLLYLNVLQLTC